MKLTFLKTIILIFILSTSIIHADSNKSDPVIMIENLTNTILEELSTNREAFQNDPEKTLQFAQEHLLPHIDTYRMARFVVGRPWREATTQQRDAFVDAFTKTLLNSYSNSLLALDIKEINIIKAEETRKRRQRITTEVILASGSNTTIVYRVHQNRDSKQWLLYDFSVEGISLLINYRKMFAPKIVRDGLDKVTQDLNSQNTIHSQG